MLLRNILILSAICLSGSLAGKAKKQAKKAAKQSTKQMKALYKALANGPINMNKFKGDDRLLALEGMTPNEMRKAIGAEIEKTKPGYEKKMKKEAKAEAKLVAEYGPDHNNDPSGWAKALEVKPEDFLYTVNEEIKALKKPYADRFVNAIEAAVEHVSQYQTGVMAILKDTLSQDKVEALLKPEAQLKNYEWIVSRIYYFAVAQAEWSLKSDEAMKLKSALEKMEKFYLKAAEILATCADKNMKKDGGSKPKDAVYRYILTLDTARDEIYDKAYNIEGKVANEVTACLGKADLKPKIFKDIIDACINTFEFNYLYSDTVEKASNNLKDNIGYGPP